MNLRHWSFLRLLNECIGQYHQSTFILKTQYSDTLLMGNDSHFIDPLSSTKLFIKLHRNLSLETEQIQYKLYLQLYLLILSPIELNHSIPIKDYLSDHHSKLTNWFTLYNQHYALLVKSIKTFNISTVTKRWSILTEGSPSPQRKLWSVNSEASLSRAKRVHP